VEPSIFCSKLLQRVTHRSPSFFSIVNSTLLMTKTLYFQSICFYSFKCFEWLFLSGIDRFFHFAILMDFNNLLQVDSFPSWLKLAFHLFYDQEVERVDRLVDQKMFLSVSGNESVVVYCQYKLSTLL